MSLNWNWNGKIGEVTIKEHYAGETFKVNLYEGNAFLIFIYEFTEDGKEKYNVWSFWADREHAKNCLGISKDCDNIYVCDDKSIFGDWVFYKDKSKNYTKIIELLCKAFDNVSVKVERSE